MTTYKCIIVDDEPIAIRVIKNYLSNFEEFEILAECANAIDAMKVLRQENVDLVFLDIEMPALTGIDMLKSLSTAPKVIFTTAHRNYAVEAFDVNALDYLMKPISFDRFTKAINKFLSDILLEIKDVSDKSNHSIVVKVEKKNVKLDLEQILFIESLSDYVIIHTVDKKMVTKERISCIEEKLKSTGFLRVHRGFIVNKSQVTAWYGNTIELGSYKIPIGRNYKLLVNEHFNQ